MKNILWMFMTPRIVVKKGNQIQVERADPREQAELLCVLLFTAMPSQVVREFLEMTGSDLELVSDIGNKADIETRAVPAEVKERIKEHKGSCRQAAAEFGVSASYVSLIRKNGG